MELDFERDGLEKARTLSELMGIAIMIGEEGGTNVVEVNVEHIKQWKSALDWALNHVLEDEVGA